MFTLDKRIGLFSLILLIILLGGGFLLMPGGKIFFKNTDLQESKFQNDSIHIPREMNGRISESKPKKILPFIKNYKGSLQSRLMKVDYEGTRIENLTDERIEEMKVSPNFKKLIYSTVPDIFGYTMVKVIDLETQNISDVAYYSGEVSSASLFEWSVDSSAVMWLVQYREPIWANKIEYFNFKNDRPVAVPDPFEESVLFKDPFLRKISPKGNFIALIVGQFRTQGRSVLLYDVKAQQTKVLRDGLLNGIFFDSEEILFIEDIPLWIKYDPFTGTSTNFTTKPNEWEILAREGFYLDSTEFYFCGLYSKIICTRNILTNEEKIFLASSELIASEQVWFSRLPYISADGNYGFVEVVENFDRFSLWSISLPTRKIKKVAEWDSLKHCGGQDCQEKIRLNFKKFISSKPQLDTNDWKIYKDNQLPVIFKYPKEWTIVNYEQNGKKILFIPSALNERSATSTLAHTALKTQVMFLRDSLFYFSYSQDQNLAKIFYSWLDQREFNEATLLQFTLPQNKDAFISNHPDGFVFISIPYKDNLFLNFASKLLDIDTNELDETRTSLIKTIIESLEFL